MLLLLVRVAASGLLLVLRLVTVLWRVIATLLWGLWAVAVLRRLSGLRAGAVTILRLPIAALLSIVTLGRGRSIGLTWLLPLRLRLRLGLRIRAWL